MGLRCRLSVSASSTAPSQTHSTRNVNLSIISNTYGWPGGRCGIRRGRRLCFIPNSMPRNALVKQQSPKVSFRREELGNPPLGNFLFSQLVPADRIRVANSSKVWLVPKQGGSHDRIVSPFVCQVKLDSEQDVEQGPEAGIGLDEKGGQLARGVGQFACWVVAVVYVVWLFILPYAPGDPVWAISPSTIQMLIDLSLNFFFVLPIASSLTYAAGLHGLVAPVLHPTAEALFNIVIGWTLLFAPLLFTDKKRDRFGGSLETLWIIQMFLTNTVLAPYMAIRLNSSPADTRKASGINLEVLSRGMTKGAYIIGVAGATVGLISILWGFVGRPEGDFGGLSERWEYFLDYVASERLAYAFLWDIGLYTFFQPWLIADNLDNVRAERREIVKVLRFVPYVGLVAYLIGLEIQGRPEKD